MILSSAVTAAWQAIARIMKPQEVEHLPVLIIATVVGYIGNEVSARISISAGRAIHI